MKVAVINSQDRNSILEVIRHESLKKYGSVGIDRFGNEYAGNDKMREYAYDMYGIILIPRSGGWDIKCEKSTLTFLALKREYK